MMILDQVLRRKMQVVSMDDTLAVAVRKLRELDHVSSPIIASSEEWDLNDDIQILATDDSLRFFVHIQNQEGIAV